MQSVLAASNDWVWVPDGAMHVRTDDVIVIAYPDWFMTPTGARVLDTERDPAQLVDEVNDIVRGWGRDRVWWTVSDTTRPPALEPELLRRGASVTTRMDVLAVPLGGGVPDLAVPHDLEVRRVVDAQGVRDFYLVNNDAFRGPAETTDEQVEFALTELTGGLRDDSVGRVVSYVDGHPAGAGGWALFGAVCRLWGGATHSDFRRRGAYRAVLAERLRIAALRGATLGLTHGVVDTSSPILRRSGFTCYGEQRQLVAEVG